MFLNECSLNFLIFKHIGNEVKFYKKTYKYNMALDMRQILHSSRKCTIMGLKLI